MEVLLIDAATFRYTALLSPRSPLAQSWHIPTILAFATPVGPDTISSFGTRKLEYGSVTFGIGIKVSIIFAALDFARGWIKAACSSWPLLAPLCPFAILAARFSVSALMLSFVLGFRRCGARGFGGYIHESSTRCLPEDYTTQK
ncbi:hypothetical protein AYI69_g1150 [Smittium culicis]|uniref:Uncharacterized protein n=1 Tax=Smittium culicis TaxID=133412 RepID=A0A1R1YR53_9FUNG|nr:hypothetical protein AYI69_g1150 [Smittium culicis]